MLLLITAVDLGLRAKWSWKRLILIALAGTVPFLSFVAERSATKDIRRQARRSSRSGRPRHLATPPECRFVDIAGLRAELVEALRRASGRICSFPIKATMRSKSSIVANSMTILPLVLPNSTFTRVSKWSESRSARSLAFGATNLGLTPLPCSPFRDDRLRVDELLDGPNR